MNRKSIRKRKLYSILLVFFIFSFLSIFSIVLLFRDVINILFFIQIAYFIFCKFYTKFKKMMVREFPIIIFWTGYNDFLVYTVYWVVCFITLCNIEKITLLYYISIFHFSFFVYIFYASLLPFPLFIIFFVLKLNYNEESRI